MRPHSQLSNWKSPGALSPGANRIYVLVYAAAVDKFILTNPTA